MRGKVALKKLIRKRGANRVKRGYTPALDFLRSRDQYIESARIGALKVETSAIRMADEPRLRWVNSRELGDCLRPIGAYAPVRVVKMVFFQLCCHYRSLKTPFKTFREPYTTSLSPF
jgi:hypothetical protein